MAIIYQYQPGIAFVNVNTPGTGGVGWCRNDYVGNAGSVYVNWENGPTRAQAAGGTGFQSVALTSQTTGIGHQRSVKSKRRLIDHQLHSRVIAKRSFVDIDI